MLALVQAALLLLVAAGGISVVLTRDPLRQAMVVSAYGLVLALLFFSFQAPDVALSTLVIGVVILPLIILLALAKVRNLDIASRRSGEPEP